MFLSDSFCTNVKYHTIYCSSTKYLLWDRCILLKKPSATGFKRQRWWVHELRCSSWMGQTLMSCFGQPGCLGTPQEALRTVHGSQLPGWTCIPCCGLYYSKSCQGRKPGANTYLPYLLNREYALDLEQRNEPRHSLSLIITQILVFFFLANIPLILFFGLQNKGWNA